MIDDLYIEKNGDTYIQLQNDLKQGKIYTKDDLTYDLLYTLSIKESVSDYLIGNIFQLNKGQVCNLRKKYNLQNRFVRRMIDFPEFYLERAKKLGVSDCDLETYYNSIRALAKTKNWDLKYVENCIAEKLKTITYDSYLDCDFQVQVSSDYNTINRKKLSQKRNDGKRVDQEKTFYQKRNAGKLGEKIVFDYLNKNLSDLGFVKINWVSNIYNSKETYDGLGYDISVIRENNEKIYIEVKTSTSIQNYIHFNISSKEVSFMHGLLPGINKEQAYIYYVYNIDFDSLNANILIIDYHTFANFKLQPTQ